MNINNSSSLKQLGRSVQCRVQFKFCKMTKVNGAAIERLYEEDDSDGEIEFMQQPHSAAASTNGAACRPTSRLPHRRGANATRAARVVHRNNRASSNANSSSGGSLSASSSPAKSGNSCGSPVARQRSDSNQRIKELVLSQFDLIKKQG